MSRLYFLIDFGFIWPSLVPWLFHSRFYFILGRCSELDQTCLPFRSTQTDFSLQILSLICQFLKFSLTFSDYDWHIDRYVCLHLIMRINVMVNIGYLYFQGMGILCNNITCEINERCMLNNTNSTNSWCEISGNNF